MYVGEICYRGEVHAGEHEAILDRSLFDEVQNQLAANKVEKQIKAKGQRAIFAGHIYDDRGNAMTPSHTVKKGVRYRYYISHAILQKREAIIGSVSRVPAAELEDSVIQAMKARYEQRGDAEFGSLEEILARVARAVITPAAINLHIVERAIQGEESSVPVILALPWSRKKFMAVKG